MVLVKPIAAESLRISQPRPERASPGTVTNKVWLFPEENLCKLIQRGCEKCFFKPDGAEEGVLVDPPGVQSGIQLAVNGGTERANVKWAATVKINAMNEDDDIQTKCSSQYAQE